MKTAAALLLLLSSAEAFAPSPVTKAATAARIRTTATSLAAATTGDDNDDRMDIIASLSRPSKMVITKPPYKLKKGDVMLDPDYWLVWITAFLGPLIIWYHPSYAADGSPSLIGVCGGLFHMLFSTLLWVQTRRVRCVFEKDAFEFYNLKGNGLDLSKGARLEEKPYNYVASTPNRWKYDKITNYDFFPSESLPIVVYFKETQTPPEKWNRWGAMFDTYGRGQPHLFPSICSVKQFKEQMEKRGVKKQPVPVESRRKRN